MHVGFKWSRLERMPACCQIQTRQKKKKVESDEDEEHLDRTNYPLTLQAVWAQAAVNSSQSNTSSVKGLLKQCFPPYYRHSLETAIQFTLPTWTWFISTTDGGNKQRIRVDCACLITLWRLPLTNLSAHYVMWFVQALRLGGQTRWWTCRCSQEGVVYGPDTLPNGRGPALFPLGEHVPHMGRYIPWFVVA